MEVYRIEVDGRYLDDIAISTEDSISKAIDGSIDLAEDMLGKPVRGFYFCPERNLISLYVGLWSNK